MGWSRRRFLATAGAMAVVGLARGALGRAATPRPVASPAVGAPGERALRERLRRLVETRALAVDDPWVLMHAVLALGPDARHAGAPALEVVVGKWLERVERGGARHPAFPLAVEAHPNHFLEIMYAVGVAPERPLATGAGPVTRADIYAGAKALFTPAIQGPELPWTVSVFTAEMRPGADRFENAEGRAFTVAAVVEALAQAAETGYADALAAKRGQKPYGRSALQAYACNGTHVLGGLLDAVARGYTARELRPRVRVLVEAAAYRLGPEVALIEEVIGAAPGPLAALNADAATLQFLGHSLESLARARAIDLWTPSAAEEAALAGARRELAAVVERLVETHDLDALARQVPRAYSVVLGDACHALHALAPA